MASKLFRKLQVTKFSSNFREAVKIVEAPIPTPGSKEVLIKNIYAGINATDINVSAGRTYGDSKLPYDIGFEGIGLVERAGEGSSLKPKTPVFFLTNNAYSEYLVMPEKRLVPLPELSPKYMLAGVGGLTATIALDEVGKLKKGDKVLITAAAGGTGHICVQWAKLKGCHVIGTCSSKAKEELLKTIGCDKIINYKEEDLDKALSRDYPNGVDVIWETIGGSTTEMLFKHVAQSGRMVLIGGITGYKNGGFPPVNINNLFAKLTMKSISLNGFLIFHHAHKYPEYFQILVSKIASGELKPLIDDGSKSQSPFIGLPKVIDAVEHLHSGTNVGKVVAKIAE